MTNIERLTLNPISESTEEASQANPWEVGREQLPSIFATTAGGPEEIFGYYGEATKDAIAKEEEEGKNEKPAITESTEEQIAKDKRGKKTIDLLTTRGRERLRRIVEGIGSAGLRFA